MNQHFVPRCYLKNFSDKVAKDYFVNVFDKLKNKHFRTNIKNICSETNLYTLDEDNEINQDLLAVEKLYSDFIEPMYLRAYEILIDNNRFEISEKERIEIIIGALHLYMRNPRILNRILLYNRIEISKAYDNAILKNSKGMTYMDEDFSFREWNKEQIIKFFAKKSTNLFKEKHFYNTGKISLFHENIKIEVNIAREHDSEFLTSDNPLVVEDFITKEEDLFSKAVELFIPLNNKFVLKLYHDNKKVANKIYRAYIPNGNVSTINSALIEKSSRFVIGNKSAFEHCEKVDKILSDESFDFKMDFFDQLIQVGSRDGGSVESKEACEVLQRFYDKCKQEGAIDKELEQEVFQALRNIAIKDKRRKME